MLTTGTRVVCRWSGKTGTVLPRDASVRDRRQGELVRLDPFVPQWSGEASRELHGIEVIYHRRDLQVLSEEG